MYNDDTFTMATSARIQEGAKQNEALGKDAAGTAQTHAVR